MNSVHPYTTNSDREELQKKVLIIKKKKILQLNDISNTKSHLLNDVGALFWT